jgi:hypothetical protein
MTKQSKDGKDLEKNVNNICQAIEGEKIAVVIPALIYVLAMAYDPEAMTKEEFVAEVGKDITHLLGIFEVNAAEEEKENISWLQ